MYNYLKRNKDTILKLLHTSYVPIPLGYSISGSNSTFVANTIWKSIHEPVHIEHFRMGAGSTDGSPASGAGADVSITPSTTESLLMVPIRPEVNHALVERVRSWTTDVEHVLEISDREVPIVHDGMLWTNRVSIRTNPKLIRGDVRKPKTGWVNADDKTLWTDWKKETNGSPLILSVGIWGSMETIK